MSEQSQISESLKKWVMMMSKLVLAFIFLATSAFADENPTPEQHLKAIEASTVYRDIVAKGFTGTNASVDLALLEVMVTKELTEKTASGLTEDQLDLIGPILAYSRKAKKLPEGLVKAFRSSPRLLYARKRATMWEERAGSYSSYGCYTGGMDPLLACPDDRDNKFTDGKSYARVFLLDNLEKGEASQLYFPRSLLQKTKPQFTDGVKLDKSLEALNPLKLDTKTMKADAIQAQLSKSKTEHVWLTIRPWNIRQHDEMKDGKGAVLNVWSSEDPGPPMIVKIPFKEFVDHAKLAGWEGIMRPGCDGDSIEVIATLKGKTTVTNKMGLLVEVPILEAVVVSDGYGFYKK